MEQYLIANYHSHTTRCKHAWGSEREYIEAAIASGIQILGFADHAPCPFKDGFISGIRMDIAEVTEYVTGLRALQKEYEDQIQILIGFEAEYLPQYFEEQITLFDGAGIDYMIMGQHFLSSEQQGPYTGRSSTDDSFLIEYVDRVITGMKTGRFAYLAHPDLVNYVGDQDIYEREMRRLCTSLKELHIPLELNLLGILEHKHYPREDFWAIAGEVGNDVIFGIDAHWVEQIGDLTTYQTGLALANRYHLNIIDKLPL